MNTLEAELRRAGVVKSEPFIGVSGQRMRDRVEWEIVDADYQLTQRVAGSLALKLSFFTPDVVIAVPTSGGDLLARALADELELDCLHLEWVDRVRSTEMRFVDPSADHVILEDALNAVLVDDVLTTGGTIEKALKTRGVAEPTNVVAVGWDRSDSSRPKGFNLPVVSAVERWLP